MQKIELLAPAQNYECAISAINSGADAVYIGTNAYGARKNAGNSLEDIEKIISYAHLFNVKVYVTVNTILDDNELIECQKLIQKLYEIKTDAIIITDFGILNLALDDKIPPIVLHMSTQCDNRTVEKIKFFENIGIKRVILARELTLEQIKKIKKNTNIELEHFVHGALCVSYSGCCYMSQFIGKRSANRGDCAQACRKKYSLINKKGEFLAKNRYLLSLKDNNLSKHLNKLYEAGIESFKIEGRLKDKNYVKNVVLYYHNLLKDIPRKSRGKIISDFTPNPYKSFNRGFCDDYLFNKKDNIYNFHTPKSTGELIGEVNGVGDNFFSVKTNLELNPQDGLCFIENNDLEGCLINSVQKIKNGYKVFPNKKINIKKGVKIYRNIDQKFNKTLENSKTQRKLEINFIIDKDSVSVFDENNIKINYPLQDFEIAQNQEKMKENSKKSLFKTSDTPYLVKNIEFKSEALRFIPLSTLNEIRRKILEELSQKIISRYKVKKQKPLNIAKFPLDEGDYKLNVHNSKAKEFYETAGVKISQMSLESTNNTKKIELMRTKHCLKRAFLGCRGEDELFLADDRGQKYPLIFDCKNCEMVVMSPD